MPGLMADHNVRGQFRDLLWILQSATWRDLWDRLHVTVQVMEGVGLDRTSSDLLVWQTCQARGIVLLTGNRHDEGPDSLEATIRTFNQLDSLPVITLSDPQRFKYDRPYVEKVAERVLDYLINLDDHLGAGRLYAP